MEDKWVKSVLHTEDIQVGDVSLGISNDSRLVRADGSYYIWRRPKPGSVHDWKQEMKLEMEAHELDVPLIAFNTENGEKITRYVPDLVEFRDCTDGDKCERVGILLGRLHKLPVPDCVFDPFALYMEYRGACVCPVSFEFEEAVLAACKAIWSPSVFCHNDLVSGNLLFGERDYLIDYEFAGANDPHFDAASFFSENEITDEGERASFYKGYGSLDDGRVRLFERLADMIWANWAQSLWEMRGEPLFLEIRDKKLAHYHQISLHSVVS